jgi:hypothetical protein
MAFCISTRARIVYFFFRLFELELCCILLGANLMRILSSTDGLLYYC